METSSITVVVYIGILFMIIGALIIKLKPHLSSRVEKIFHRHRVAKCEHLIIIVSQDSASCQSLKSASCDLFILNMPSKDEGNHIWLGLSKRPRFDLLSLAGALHHR